MKSGRASRFLSAQTKSGSVARDCLTCVHFGTFLLDWRVKTALSGPIVLQRTVGYIGYDMNTVPPGGLTYLNDVSATRAESLLTVRILNNVSLVSSCFRYVAQVNIFATE